MLLPFITILAIIIIVCVFLSRASSRFGIPVLLAFLLFGMLSSNNTILPLNLGPQDKAFDIAASVCTFALIFIMFFGGFGTRWKSAKSVIREASLLSTVGVLLTAVITGVFCHFVLRWAWMESLLLGAVVSSTDAASVFSILRGKKLGLKNNSAPMIEVESGSNDPMSYMLTILMLSVIRGEASIAQMILTLVSQIVLGGGLGIAIALGVKQIMKRFKFGATGFDSLFILAVALLSYAIPSITGGNGYLSAYIVGIFLGNMNFDGKKALVNFMDGITDLMMIVIFFILGMLAKPEKLLMSIVPALLVFLCLLLIARPLSTYTVLRPFRKYSLSQIGFISFVGLRGAASIVFAIIAVSRASDLNYDIFSVVFCIVLISIALQGSLIPFAAGKFGMADPSADVMRTFSDFSDETDLQFSDVQITSDSSWKDKAIMDLNIPENLILCMIIRSDGTKHVPDGKTVLHEGDRAVLCSFAHKADAKIKISTHVIESTDEMVGCKLKDCEIKDKQILLIRRNSKRIIPNGETTLKEGDELYYNLYWNN